MAQMKVKLPRRWFRVWGNEPASCRRSVSGKNKIKTSKCSFGEIQRTFLSLYADYKIPLIQLLCVRREIFVPFVVDWMHFHVVSSLRFCWHSKAGTFLHNVKVNEGRFSPHEALHGFLSWNSAAVIAEKRWNCLHSEQFFVKSYSCQFICLKPFAIIHLWSILNFPFCWLTKLHRRRCIEAR